MTKTNMPINLSIYDLSRSMLHEYDVINSLICLIEKFVILSSLI